MQTDLFLRNWVEKLTTVPAEEDTCFVIGSKINANTTVIVFSSLRLIQNAVLPHWCWDATYKISFRNWPLVAIVGVAPDRTWRLISLSMIEKEDAAHFTEVLSLTLSAVRSFVIDFIDPVTIMSDADDSAGVAVERILPHTKQMMCWWHLANVCVWGNGRMTDAFKKLNEDEKGEVRFLMEELHGCSTAELWDELYKSVKEHFLADATEEMKAYVAYFDRQWIRSRFCNWQRFSMPDGYSVTNNPCETFNKF